MEKRERKRGNAREICVQKVIPPTLSTGNPKVVSGVKSFESSNGGQTALFTGLKIYIYIYMPVFIFYICFLQTNKSLTSKNETTGKHYSFPLSAVDFHSTDQILAAVGFASFCYFEFVCW